MEIVQSKQKNLNSRGLSHLLNTYFSRFLHKRPSPSTTAKKHGAVMRSCSITAVPANETITCVNTFRNFTIKTYARDTRFWDKQTSIL